MSAARNLELYDKYRDELLKRQLSNSENFDKAVLSLSTAALGFSLAFLKEITPGAEVKYLLLLKASWFLFGLAIIVTIFTYFLSQAGIKRAIVIAERYYLQGKDESLNEQNKPAILTDTFNAVAGGLFLAGIIATTVFVSINV